MKISRTTIMSGMLIGIGMISVGAQADTRKMSCGEKSTITESLTRLKPGDTLLVSGACVENVVIPEEINDVTLDGQGAASITALDTSASTVNIRGRGITLTGFTIGGGSNGILVGRGGAAMLNVNVIQTAGTGISITSNGTARILNNTIWNNSERGVSIAESATGRLDGNLIQNNNLDGVLINENASARIGLDSPNTIQGNRGRGVVVTRSSNARITGNIITNNTSRGVDVLRGSHADIIGNTIDANGSHGILVNYNSAVNLDEPNTGSSGQFGIVCLNSGMVDGRRGSLTGGSGQTSFNNGCIDNTIP